MTTFTVELDLRADEPSAFVPSAQLAGARVGDAVTVRSTHLDGLRTGIVAEVIDDAAACRVPSPGKNSVLARSTST